MFGNGASHFTRAWTLGSKNFDRKGRHPDVELLESTFEPFLERDEELAAFGQIHRIDKEPDRVVSEEFISVTPETANGLSLARDSTKTRFEFEQCVRNEFVRDRLPVVKLARQEVFESTK